jgi:hypothetical protein
MPFQLNDKRRKITGTFDYTEHVRSLRALSLLGRVHPEPWIRGRLPGSQNLSLHSSWAETGQWCLRQTNGEFYWVHLRMVKFWGCQDVACCVTLIFGLIFSLEPRGGKRRHLDKRRCIDEDWILNDQSLMSEVTGLGLLQGSPLYQSL